MSDMLPQGIAEKIQALADEMKPPEAYPCAVCLGDIPVGHTATHRITSWHVKCDRVMKEYDDLFTTEMIDAATRAYRIEITKHFGHMSTAHWPAVDAQTLRRHAKAIVVAALKMRGTILPIPQSESL